VQIDFYYVPSYEYSSQFVDMLQIVYDKLKDKILFEPSIVTFKSKSEEFKNTNCISDGKYCAFDPDNEGPITGRDVILESLRQKCVYKIGISQYFSYMQLFYAYCMFDFSEECSRGLIERLGLDPFDVLSCVDNSFLATNNQKYSNDNTILAEERDKQRKAGLNSFPNIYINDVLYQGTLSYYDLLLSICSSLNDITMNCRNLDFEDTDYNILTIIMLHVGIYIACVILLAFICKKIAKRRYEKELNKAVNKYVTEYSVLKADSIN